MTTPTMIDNDLH